MEFLQKYKRAFTALLVGSIMAINFESTTTNTVRYKRAFTALLVGSTLAIMIGAVLLVVSYVVINAIVGSTGVIGNAALNTSLTSNISNITSALNIAGIGLIVAGIAGIVYMLIGLGGVGSGRR